MKKAPLPPMDPAVQSADEVTVTVPEPPKSLETESVPVLTEPLKPGRELLRPGLPPTMVAPTLKDPLTLTIPAPLPNSTVPPPETEEEAVRVKLLLKASTAPGET